MTVAAFASCPAELAVLAVRSLPGVAPAGHGRAVADGRVGARARGVAPMVSARALPAGVLRRPSAWFLTWRSLRAT